MYILAIETTGAHASIALVDDQGNLWEERSTEKLSHLQNLIPMIGRLLERRGLTLADLTAIAVSEGPGSFTGIRIGMSTAKALAQVRDLPVISVPTLTAFALLNHDFRGILCPMLDARRSQVYGGVYRCGTDGSVEELVAAAAYDLAEYFERVDQVSREVGTALFFGDGTPVYRQEILSWKKDAMFAPEDKNLQQASSVALLAIQLHQQGKEQSLFTLQPAYLRKAEAERKLEEAEK